MAEKKISQLTAKGATVADTDLLVISESAGGGVYNTKSVTGANVKALVTDANMTTTDITTNDVSTSKHGFAPKAPNDGTKFLDGTGAYDTVKDSDLSLSDVTTNDVSTTKHGFTPKAPNDTTKFLRGDGTWAVPSSGGLTKFTEAENTSAPNGTVYVDSLTAAASSTNADFAILPKGTGAILADVPDNTSTGGNKRGQYAVDLQMVRSSASQVASGDYSFMTGNGNTCSGLYSAAFGVSTTVAGSVGNFGYGYGSTVSNNYSFGGGYFSSITGQSAVGIGQGVTASGNYSTAFGTACQSTGESSFSVGSNNVSNADYSSSFGFYGRVFGIQARQVLGRVIAVAGDCQKSTFVLGIRTTNATATTLTIGGGAAGTTNQVILQNDNAFRFKGTIIGKKSGTTDVAAWDIDGLIVRGANAASTTLSISNVNMVQNTPAWGTPTLAADTTNGGLRVQVTGAASTNIQWTCTVETTEVIYA